MREPRPRQRLPEGGLDIFEKQKAGLWKSTTLLIAHPEGKRAYVIENYPKDEMLRWGYVLFYQPHFDPMLYFWPCDGFHINFHVDNQDTDHTKRLVRAALRDGAEIVVTHTRGALSSSSKFYTPTGGWKKADAETEYQVRKAAR